jgi:alkylhydroperoxidase family enzyme
LRPEGIRYALTRVADSSTFESERAALALTEAATRLSDRSDPVLDEIWEEAARCYDDAQLASPALSITAINGWNRLNVTMRQPAGSWS